MTAPFSESIDSLEIFADNKVRNRKKIVLEN
jgi:hypothetical protein